MSTILSYWIKHCIIYYTDPTSGMTYDLSKHFPDLSSYLRVFILYLEPDRALQQGMLWLYCSDDITSSWTNPTAASEKSSAWNITMLKVQKFRTKKSLKKVFADR